MVVDAKGQIVFVGPALEAALGLGPLAGFPLDICASHIDLPRTVIDRASSGTPRFSVTWTALGDGGWLGLLDSAPGNPAPDVPKAPDRDPVTGLMSSAGLLAALGEALAVPTEPGRDLCVIYLDLDYFQGAVEQVGLAGTPTLLARVARRLTSATRSTDIVARLSDDDFAVVLTSDSGRDGPWEVANRLREILSRPFLFAGRSLHLGASLGLALRSQGAQSGEELVRLAKMAMDHGRRTMRGRIEWYEPTLGQAIRVRRDIETGLRRALLLGEFELHYQPQVDLESGAISGFEALVRWRHPTLGLIMPGAFIEIAEDLGLLPSLGAWVLEEACRAASGWDSGFSIAVNVAPVQFDQPDFEDIVAHALSASGLDPARLELELTETGLLEHTELTVARMNRLRALGVRLALDDFGTGYASLNYLRQFPFDKIKMDQSFVRGPMADQNALRIVGAIADLGRGFGMSVLAEGVETADQLARIIERGCNGVQGYFVSRPIPEAEIPGFVADYAATRAVPFDDPAGPEAP